MNRPLLTLLSASILLASCTDQRPLHIVRDHADRYYAGGQYEAALAEYTEYVDRYPGDPTARLQLARTMMHLGEPRKASEQLAIAYNVVPDDEDVIDAMCEANYAAGDRDSLIQFLRRLCNERGTTNDYLRLGRYSALVGNADEAMVAYKTAAKIDEGRSLRPQLELAEFYISVDDRDNALNRLRMAHYVDPLNNRVIELIRQLGEVPGPSFAMRPIEAVPLTE